MGSVVEQCLRLLPPQPSGSGSGPSGSSTTTNKPIVSDSDTIRNDCDPTKKVGEEFEYDTVIEELEYDDTTTFVKESEIDVYLLEANVKNESDFDIL